VTVVSLPDMVDLGTIQAALDFQKRNKWRGYFPETGPRRRALYPKQLEFFAAGATYKERLFCAANRIGKSDAGAYETACHLTGNYPVWWTGKRFSGPTAGWACGTTSESTRNIVQFKLAGTLEAQGTGMIPADRIVKTLPRRSGLSGSIETIWVKHVSGAWSSVGLKTYEQGRKSFEGVSLDFAWLDEEPPEDIYTEILFRTVTTRGILYTTFTPLQGMSEVVTGFLEPKEGAAAHKFWIQAGWKDVPHMEQAEKDILIATTPAYQIKARTLGEPSLGAGAIYPLPEEDFLIKTAPIPASWRRVYALDVGWRLTAALWAAENPGNGQLVLYDEHYQSAGEPASHAMAIRARGEWIHGVVDPGCLQSSQVDGRSLMEHYRKAGLMLHPCENAVETGIQIVWERLVSGRLKVQEHLQNFRREISRYHRDEKGKIVKKNDHLMDCVRYVLSTTGLKTLTSKPQPRPSAVHVPGGDRSWMT